MHHMPDTAVVAYVFDLSNKGLWAVIRAHSVFPHSCVKLFLKFTAKENIVWKNSVREIPDPH